MIEVRKSENFEITVDYNREVNYVACFNGTKFCKSIAIKNLGSRAVNNISLILDGYYFAENIYEIDTIGAKKSVTITCSDFNPELEKLILLAEEVFTEVSITINSKTRELAAFKIPVNIQAWNFWEENSRHHEFIASFVMPNHEYPVELMAKASRILKETDPSNTMSGYDASTSERFLGQIGAIWSAISTEDIKYLTQIFNGTEEGQKIMTVDMIKKYRQGNCMDLSILLCSCLERLNLCPLLLFVPGHVMVGVWLNPFEVLENPVSFDNKSLSKSILDRKKSKMIVLEATMLRFEGSTIEKAFEAAYETIKKSRIDFVVDIVAARVAGIKPLPFAFSPIDLTEVEKLDIAGYKVLSAGSQRQEGWERKLLDISLRNPMLNLKPGKSYIKFQDKDIEKVINSFKANKLTDLIEDSEKDKEEKLKNIYRGARSSIEESGANNLFFALGSLVWYDIDDPQSHIAPLIFVPATIVRKKAMTYEVRMRDDESIVNVTLLEMMRQMFGVKFPELDPLPLDESGIPSWNTIYNAFEDQIREINLHQEEDKQWKINSDSYLGIFSFSKFLMWNDIHSHPAILLNHPVIRGMIENIYIPDEPNDHDEISPSEFEENLILPVDFDSSQLKAVHEAHNDKSFVLYGPPGTGKSQTITNMIADAVYNGKRVLFVAEKRAALEVVQTRLAKIGLSPFCLELHSNKTDKKSFFSQLEESYIQNIGKGQAKRQSKLYHERKLLLKTLSDTLEETTNALHGSLEQDISVYDAIIRFINKRYNDISFRYEEIKHIGKTELNILRTELLSLDIVCDLLGMHPGDCDLVGLYPKSNTIDNQEAITEIVNKMPESIARARKKANGIINRLFFRKQPHEILKNNNLWKQLESLATLDEKDLLSIDDISRKLERWRSSIEVLKEWYHFSDKVNRINSFRIPKIIDYYLQGHKGVTAAEVFLDGYCKSIINHHLDTNKALRGFNGLMHENKISNYLAIDASFQDLKKKHLTAKIESAVKNLSLSLSEQQQLTLLMKRMLSKGRGVSLRKVLNDSWDIIQKAFPCMLMSPLSVAQYLEMKANLFDLIIFDEASQMETADSIGVIARGKTIVVVGDPKQLPPTRFFTTQTATGEEIEESEDADSILEDCITLGLPSHYLTRHYRSRHESLISFSNNNFYDNKLLTFPSVNDAQKKVRLIDPCGIYDVGKTRTNKIEAEAVVKYIVDFVSQHPEPPSIGVVAFSKAQSNLIEDLLNVKLQRNKILQQKLDECHEPIFIKNLENVQGDERDIIIFSIGYGPDINGNVTLNFGPINQAGGERRLNVAVSRAREEMIVFTSLKPHHIPKERFSKGVETLRKFLEYAFEESSEDKAEQMSHETVDTLVAQIIERLRNSGINAMPYIGRSDFKIDIAIPDENDAERYKLGIIIDGRNYYSLPTTRDREVVIPAMLNQLGWELHRVWVIDWLTQPEKVMEGIFNHLKKKR